ncbi:MAG TPA: hypothetical protein VJM50_17775, partial [Pyrinomonadaceae bacterium]|nr:hypothetical protein [Pyrinomonadaceae bacterium]
RIVTAKTADKVTEEVMSLLEAGWELHGDLKVDTGVYSQPMIQQEYPEYAGIDYNILVTIEDLDEIKYAINSISDALETVAKALASDKHTK